MQYSQEHLKTMVYAEFGEQTECIMGNWKIENGGNVVRVLLHFFFTAAHFHLALVAASISYFVTVATKFSCCSSKKINVFFVF